MTLALDILIAIVSIAFLSILGTVAGLLIPSLFLGAFAPWLDRLLPIKRSR